MKNSILDMVNLPHNYFIRTNPAQEEVGKPELCGHLPNSILASLSLHLFCFYSIKSLCLRNGNDQTRSI